MASGSKSRSSSRSPLGETDVYLFHEGTHLRPADHFGGRLGRKAGKDGADFSVWAPAARVVSVIGDFNEWRSAEHPLKRRKDGETWEGFVAGARHGDAYKFHVESKLGDYRVDKADPFALFSEVPPRTASRLWNLDYAWGDQAWLDERRLRHADDQPISIYEMHLGSFLRHRFEENRHWGYREILPRLVEHVREAGFTHVEFLPLTEHPFYGTWGYGTTGYYAPTSRFGTPQDLMFLIDGLHQAGIGVILDWVPAHFPSDESSIGYFDGTWLFEHADPRKGWHPDWQTKIFNYGRPEVRAFLVGSALFWIEKYHVDGLRIDAVASMLYLDYSRKEGEWEPNERGGRENLEAIAFLRQLNDAVHGEHPDVLVVAEESTAWPMVSRPTAVGGLGFDMKWDMGWMHDTLKYLSADPVFRKFQHNQITFRQIYAGSEDFLLPLSHDEVVHGKGSLFGRMAGDERQKFANLRLLFAWQWLSTGKKLLFMGGEFGQRREWNHESELDWELLERPGHRGVFEFVKRLNALYAGRCALHRRDFGAGGFEWIDCADADQSVVSFLRRSGDPVQRGADDLLAVFHFTPLPRAGYRVGVPRAGRWRLLLNGDDPRYHGGGATPAVDALAEALPAHGRPWSLVLDLPPLAVLLFEHEDAPPPHGAAGAAEAPAGIDAP